MCLFHHIIHFSHYICLFMMAHSDVHYIGLIWMNIIVTHFNNIAHTNTHRHKQTNSKEHIHVTMMMMMILDWQLRTLMFYNSWFHSLSYLIWLYSKYFVQSKISIKLNTYANNAHFIIFKYCPPFSFHFKCLSLGTQHEEPFFFK